jgi:hypothetical protein
LNGAAEILDMIRHDPSRSRAFWLLYANHDEVLARSQFRRTRWRAVLAKLRALGLTNADGNLVTIPEALRNTWGWVYELKCREAEAKRQRAAARTRPSNDPPPLALEAPDA